MDVVKQNSNHKKRKHRDDSESSEHLSKKKKVAPKAVKAAKKKKKSNGDATGFTLNLSSTEYDIQITMTEKKKPSAVEPLEEQGGKNKHKPKSKKKRGAKKWKKTRIESTSKENLSEGRNKENECTLEAGNDLTRAESSSQQHTHIASHAARNQNKAPNKPVEKNAESQHKKKRKSSAMGQTLNDENNEEQGVKKKRKKKQKSSATGQSLNNTNTEKQGVKKKRKRKKKNKQTSSGIASTLNNANNEEEGVKEKQREKGKKKQKSSANTPTLNDANNEEEGVKDKQREKGKKKQKSSAITPTLNDANNKEQGVKKKQKKKRKQNSSVTELTLNNAKNKDHGVENKQKNKKKQNSSAIGKTLNDDHQENRNVCMLQAINNLTRGAVEEENRSAMNTQNEDEEEDQTNDADDDGIIIEQEKAVELVIINSDSSDSDSDSDNSIIIINSRNSDSLCGDGGERVIISSDEDCDSSDDSSDDGDDSNNEEDDDDERNSNTLGSTSLSKQSHAKQNGQSGHHVNGIGELCELPGTEIDGDKETDGDNSNPEPFTITIDTDSEEESDEDSDEDDETYNEYHETNYDTDGSEYLSYLEQAKLRDMYGRPIDMNRLQEKYGGKGKDPSAGNSMQNPSSLRTYRNRFQEKYRGTAKVTSTGNSLQNPLGLGTVTINGNNDNRMQGKYGGRRKENPVGNSLQNPVCFVTVENTNDNRMQEKYGGRGKVPAAGNSTQNPSSSRTVTNTNNKENNDTVDDSRAPEIIHVVPDGEDCAAVFRDNEEQQTNMDHNFGAIPEYVKFVNLANCCDYVTCMPWKDSPNAEKLHCLPQQSLNAAYVQKLATEGITVKKGPWEREEEHRLQMNFTAFVEAHKTLLTFEPECLALTDEEVYITEKEKWKLIKTFRKNHNFSTCLALGLERDLCSVSYKASTIFNKNINNNNRMQEKYGGRGKVPAAGNSTQNPSSSRTVTNTNNKENNDTVDGSRAPEIIHVVPDDDCAAVFRENEEQQTNMDNHFGAVPHHFTFDNLASCCDYVKRMPWKDSPNGEKLHKLTYKRLLTADIEKLAMEGITVKRTVWLREEEHILRMNFQAFVEAHKTLMDFEPECLVLFRRDFRIMDTEKFNRITQFRRDHRFFACLALGLERDLERVAFKATRFLDKNRNKGHYTINEMKRLRKLVKQYGASNTTKIAAIMKRTPTSISCRIDMGLSKLNKGRWSFAENKELVKAVQRVQEETCLDPTQAGAGFPWSKVAVLIPMRNLVQCRNRWTIGIQGENSGRINSRLRVELLNQMEKIVSNMTEPFDDRAVDWTKMAKDCGYVNRSICSLAWRQAKFKVAPNQPEISVQAVLEKLAPYKELWMKKAGMHDLISSTRRIDLCPLQQQDAALASTNSAMQHAAATGSSSKGSTSTHINAGEKRTIRHSTAANESSSNLIISIDSSSESEEY